MARTDHLQAHGRRAAVMAAFVAGAAFTIPPANAQSMPAADLAPVRAAVARFLRAFDNLEWEPFRASWASEPSVFFPFDDTPERVTGREAVEARFRRFFDDVKARAPGPPYLHLNPRELSVERYGDAGLVTFMLGGPTGRMARRTLLFVREGDTWKLAHMHASIAGQQ